jgi:hypothetical protein
VLGDSCLTSVSKVRNISGWYVEILSSKVSWVMVL